MRLGLITAVMASAWMIGSAPAAADDKVTVYVIDPARTKVRFTWLYLGVPTPGGSFSNVTGHIYGSKENPSQSWAEATIPVRTFKSFMPVIDSVLVNSGDYFKTKEYPVIRFRSTGISTVDKGNREFSMSGEMTVNGITRPLVLYAKATSSGPHPFYGGAQAASLNATTSFKRSEFGMGKYIGMVSDEMKVTLTVEAVEADPASVSAKAQAEMAGN